MASLRLKPAARQAGTAGDGRSARPAGPKPARQPRGAQAPTRRQDDRGFRSDRSAPAPSARRDAGPGQRPFERRAGSRTVDREDEGRAQRTSPGTAPEAGGERLNKYLARTGQCSRREADDWIGKGWVHINGQPAQMGQRLMPGDRVEIRRAATRQQAERVTILLNKPVGYVSGQAEDGYRPAASLIGAESRWADDRTARRFERSQLRGLAAAGRLDIDSTGLLVLTQDGRVARQLIGEGSEVGKEYLVRVRFGSHERNVQAVFPPGKLKLLRHGLSLDGRKLKPAEVEWQNPEQLRFVLHEGKHRQIRRMCELVGLHVTGLKRIRIGRVKLGHLPVGQWRYLGSDEEF